MINDGPKEEDELREELTTLMGKYTKQQLIDYGLMEHFPPTKPEKRAAYRQYLSDVEKIHDLEKQLKPYKKNNNDYNERRKGKCTIS